jgi:hypothetical protein
MNGHCSFAAQDGRWFCVICGRTATVRGEKPPVAVCKAAATPRPSLGDMVAAWLSAIGITKERVSAVVGGDCGCAKRQEALNELGRRVGIG